MEMPRKISLKDLVKRTPLVAGIVASGSMAIDLVRPLDAEAYNPNCVAGIIATAPVGTRFEVAADSPEGVRLDTKTLVNGQAVLTWTRPSNTTKAGRDAYTAKIYNPKRPDIKQDVTATCNNRQPIPFIEAGVPNTVTPDRSPRTVTLDATVRKSEEFAWLPAGIIAAAAILGAGIFGGSFLGWRRHGHVHQGDRTFGGEVVTPVRVHVQTHPLDINVEMRPSVRGAEAPAQPQPTIVEQ